MDIKRINPWNWLRPEDGASHQLPVARWETADDSPLTQLHRDIDQMFDRVFNSFGFDAAWPSESRFLRPQVDVASSDQEYTVSVEVPGVEEKDIKLELTDDGLLTIRGEKKREEEHKDKDYHRVERIYGAFQRTLALPEDADRDAVEARFRNGVLTVRMPRKAEQKPQGRLIEIKSAA